MKILQNKNGMFPYFQHTDISVRIEDSIRMYCREQEVVP